MPGHEQGSELQARPRDARALLREYGLAAKKSWGQNFLVDERTYRAIVEAAGLGPGLWGVEIGAGLGTLTARLAERAERVIAIERERDMIEVLHGELGEHPRVEIAEANALTFDYGAVAARAGGKPVVVGNLPYQIASPILFRLLDAREHLLRLVVMLQKEMADRILARPGTSEYGALTVMVQMLGEPHLVCRVPAGAFHPAPRVASAVLRVELAGGTRVPVGDLEVFRRLVRAAFGQRRKTLRNALRSLGPGVEAALGAAGIDGQRRGETLDVAAFARLSDELVAQGLGKGLPAPE
jgi:16S rRNA (adenine1518-N6/adenine1519-N6)-dimethyltransferase